jgi:hypothetical protein
MALQRPLRVTLNIMIHVGILMIVLVALYFFIIAGTERKALEGEFKSLIRENLTKSLEEADGLTSGNLRKVLAPSAPAMRRVRPLFMERDEGDRWFNAMLLVIAGGIGLIFIVMSFTMLGTYAAVRKTFASSFTGFSAIIMENIMLFILIAPIEFLFFTIVASHFVPIAPSFMVGQVIDHIAGEFSAPG